MTEGRAQIDSVHLVLSLMIAGILVMIWVVISSGIGIDCANQGSFASSCFPFRTGVHEALGNSVGPISAIVFSLIILYGALMRGR